MAEGRIYVWRAGGRPPLPAPFVGKELEEIAARHDGELRPQVVVDESRPEGAPLHPAFEWDDQTAAEEHRKSQARRLIHSLRVVVQNDDGKREKQIVYLSVTQPAQAPGERPRRNYKPVDAVMLNEGLRQQALIEIERLLVGVQRRYAHIRDLAGLDTFLDGVREQIGGPQS